MNYTTSKVVQIIACVAIIFTMLSSTCYHLYSAISEELTAKLLRIDLVGIGIMIFTLCLTCVFAGYHSDHLVRNSIMGIMVSIFVTNIIAQSMPCYA